MGVFSDLHDRLETVRVTKGVASLVHDRLDSINEDSANNYPMLLYRVTNEDTTTYNRDQDNPIISIDFYLSDLWYAGSTDTLAEKMDAMIERLDSVIKEIPLRGNGNGNYFHLVANSSAVYAWEQHNDNLFIVKRTVRIGASRLSC